MAMQLGAQRHRVEFQRSERQQDEETGAYTYVWSTLIRCSADVEEQLISGAEMVDDGAQLAKRRIQLEMRYRTGITSAMRVIYDNATFRIISGPAQIGRREGLAMTCEEVSTQGETP
ncbi:MAG: phage head closure protein [Pseudomonadota bacterium]